MRWKYARLPVLILLFASSLTGFSQEDQNIINQAERPLDTLALQDLIFDTGRHQPEIVLSHGQALQYLRDMLRPGIWKNPDDPLRGALNRLVTEASELPFDSVEFFLREYPYDSIDIPREKFYTWRPLHLKIPVVTEPLTSAPADTIIDVDRVIPGPAADSAGITPLPEEPFDLRSGSGKGLKDTVIMVISDTLGWTTSSYSGFPFRYYLFPYQSDSLKIAVDKLVNYLHERDSSIINFTGITDKLTPVWLNSKSGTSIRYWLKNELDDSVTVWIGSPSKDVICLYLEHGVSFRRPLTQKYFSQVGINKETLDKTTLLDARKIDLKSRYWMLRSESSVVLSGAYLSNWVKGGESSISTAFDITGFADYSNKSLKLSSNNFARIKYGLIATDEYGIRKNLDLLETNSKLNHKAFGKFDFSGIMLFKTQIDIGYNYPNDTVPVSKFFNPAILTLGFGLDYKPNKNTSINMSPLSYKGTFVPDTGKIDQTKYGIAENSRSKNEPGASFMFSNQFKPTKSISVTNRLQLFTNYINNPMNIDVDWEMILVANLNWFTDVRLNTHLIFDDDTRTPVYDKENNPVTGPDGIQKKTARIQFKELLGFSFVFRF